jgi:nucleoid-associated protein
MLTRLIAHQIRKKVHETTATLHLRDSLLPIDSQAASDLFEQLRDSFHKKNPVAGAFLTTGGTQPRFQQLLGRYLEADDDPAFIAFTADAMNVLRDEMVSQQAATGGYVVFAEYEADGTKFLFAALLGTKARPNFDRNLNLIQSPSLDLDHLRHGARIRYDKFADNDSGVVLFFSQQTVGASYYFVDFIGCQEITKPDVQGRNLYHALTRWAENRGMDEERKGQLLQTAYSYWQDCRKNRRAMTLTALANVLNPENSDALLHHLQAEQNALAGEFPPPPLSVMKMFVKFAFNRAGLKLEFDRNVWMNRVTINQAEKSVTITNVPDELITALGEEEPVNVA